MSEKDAWIRTYSGKRFYPLNPKVEDIDIEDIAHSLSLQCRFSGHCAWFYSVAQHSLYVKEMVASLGETNPSKLLAALLHDAAEAYLVDLPKPVKEVVQGYREAEERVELLIQQKFHLPPASMTKSLIKLADWALLKKEAEVLMGDPQDWKNNFVDIPDVPFSVVQKDPQYVKSWFLKEFYHLVDLL